MACPLHIGKCRPCDLPHHVYMLLRCRSRAMKSFSTLLFLMFVCKSFAQEDVNFGQSRQGNEITFTCESFRGQGEEIRIRVFGADSSNCTKLDLPMTRPIPVTSAMARFIVTPSAEKAAYYEVGDVSTVKVYFGGEQIITITPL